MRCLCVCVRHGDHPGSCDDQDMCGDAGLPLTMHGGSKDRSLCCASDAYYATSAQFQAARAMGACVVIVFAARDLLQ